MKIATKILAVLYLAAAITLEVIVIKLNVLPSKYLITLSAGLAILSMLVLVALLIKIEKKWLKIVAIVISVILIVVYSAGAAYAFRANSFLNKIGGENENTEPTVEATEPFNLYISGVDSRSRNSHKGRSDVNMVVSVNPTTHKILLTSIPRDYQIRLVDKNYATDKLTHTGIYGIDTTISSVEDLLDIDISQYILVNFDTVADFVEAVDGIDVNSDYEFSSSGRDGTRYHYVVGQNHLNGEEALAFARERHSFKDGDRQRAKNQQIVFEAMLNKALSDKSALLEYAGVLEDLDDEFSMSLTSRDIKSLIKMQLSDMASWEISRNSITGGDSHQSTYSGGKCYVMSRNEESISDAKKLIAETMKVSE